MIRLTIRNRQRATRIPPLSHYADRIVSACLVRPGSGNAVLPTLADVEVTIVSDAVISRVHAEFFGDPAPTDVITFAHGEILVSAETAARQAPVEGEPLERELIRYVVHGLLHLNGHTDQIPAEAAAMWAAQEAAVAELM